MASLRREDAANRRVALAWLGQRDYGRARGWAELLVNDDHRAELIAHLAATMPAEHKAYRKAAKARERAAQAAAKKWRAAQAASGRKGQERAS